MIDPHADEDLADGMAAADTGDSMPAVLSLADPAFTCSGCKADTKDVKSPFCGFRFHDLRHQAITELAESKASDKPSWGLPVTFQRRCSSTIHTSA